MHGSLISTLPPQKLAEQPEGAAAMKNKKQEILHYLTLPIDLE
jgi:hypothetical protein